MDGTIYCLVDRSGHVYIKDAAPSHADIAATYGLTETDCDAYRFDLNTRTLLADRGNASSAAAATAFFDERLGTPDRLMQFAEQGHLSKGVLAALLDLDGRRSFLDACAALEKHYTEACQATNEPCLEDGCAMDVGAGEVCLEPVMRAGIEYHRACAAAWAPIFADPHNRIPAWRSVNAPTPAPPPAPWRRSNAAPQPSAPRPETTAGGPPFAGLERALIDEFLRAHGYDAERVASLPEKERDTLLKQASVYASGKLSEVESRSHFLDEMHEGSAGASKSSSY